MVITFFGHSDCVINLNEEFVIKILEEIVKERQVDFYLGGYGNFDEFALKCAKKYKE